MASMLLFLFVSWFALAAAWSASPAPAPYALEDAELHFERFIQKYERNYTDENEKQARFQIFKENLQNINSLNENSKHAAFVITQFSDLSREEFKSKMTYLRTSDDSHSFEDDNPCKYFYDKDIDYKGAPESFDWREHGVVTSVKNQKICGSGYAFSATGSVESQYAINHNELVGLSVQQIVDCSKKDKGCKGGLMSVSIRSLVEQGGSESEDDYPYEANKTHCRFDVHKVKVQVTDCHSYDLNSQEKVKQLLYHTGPISIGVKADGVQCYGNGIISDMDCDVGVVNHGVLLVGYGSEAGVPFWIVKNSWNEDWGENGYFRMQRGELALSCGMMITAMVIPVVA